MRRLLTAALAISVFNNDPSAAQCGIASYYSKGRVTANGERFEKAKISAAHRTPAFGTKVTGTTSSMSVIVRINDRGPYIGRPHYRPLGGSEKRGAWNERSCPGLHSCREIWREGRRYLETPGQKAPCELLHSAAGAAPRRIRYPSIGRIFAARSIGCLWAVLAVRVRRKAARDFQWRRSFRPAWLHRHPRLLSSLRPSPRSGSVARCHRA